MCLPLLKEEDAAMGNKMVDMVKEAARKESLASSSGGADDNVVVVSAKLEAEVRPIIDSAPIVVQQQQ